MGADLMRHSERMVMLQVVDNQWKDHLISLDQLKQGIGLRAQAKKDPLVEYKKESFVLFEAMMDRIEDETVAVPLFPAAVRGASPRPELPYPDIEEWDEEDATTQTHDGASNGTGDHTRCAERVRGFHAQHSAQEGEGTRRPAVCRR